MGLKISINYFAISTELIVVFTIVGTLILDLILPRKSKYYVAAFALLGTLFSLAPLVIQWANYTSPYMLLKIALSLINFQLF